MAIYRNKKFLIIFLISIFLFSYKFVFSYDETIIHPSLTQEMAKLYNFNFGDKLTDEEIGWIKQGSIDEDKVFGAGLPARSSNHFYDPINDTGWTNTETLQILGLPSPKWAHDSIKQSEYAGGDYTWERAIWDYANGDKQHAYESLGHILHLIEDKTVPAHTRNDFHLSPTWFGQDLGEREPYEDWTRDNARNGKINFDFAQSLFQESKKPIIFDNLNRYFDNVALYTNTGFFSQDTINKYNNPQIKLYKKDGLFLYAYGIDTDGDQVVLFRMDGNKYIFDDKVFSNNWSRLAPKSILAGAGIIKLFKDEAEKAKKNPASIQKPSTAVSFYITDPVNRKADEIKSSAIAFYNWEIANGLLVYNTAQSAAVSAYNSAISAAVAAGNTVTAAITNAQTQINDLFSSAGVVVSRPFLNDKIGQESSNILADQNNSQNKIVAEIHPATGESLILPQALDNSVSYDAALILNSGQNLKFAPMQDINLNLRIKNIGTASWKKSIISLGVYMVREAGQKFYHPSWLTAIRPGILAEQVLDPGETGNFNFTIKSPEIPGDYSFRARPLWQNEKNEFDWIGTDIASWNVKVEVPENKIAILPPTPAETEPSTITPMPTPFVSYGGGGSSSASTPTPTPAEAEPPTITPTPDIVPPEKISDLVAAAGARRGTIKLSWTAPESDITYEIRYAEKEIVGGQATESEINWEDAGIISEAIEAGKPETEAGIAETFLAGKKYYFAVKSKDEAGNISDVSNVADSFPNSIAEHFVISEAASGIGSAGNEFIEIYNPTENPFNLKELGMKLILVNSSDKATVKEKITWNKDTVNPHGFFLFGVGDVGKGLDAVYSGDSLTGTSGVIFMDEAGNVIDKLGWGEKPPLEKIPPVLAAEAEGFAVSEKGGLKTGQSLERKANFSSTPESLSAGADKFLGNGWDTDNNSADFVLQSAPNPQNSESFTEPRVAPGKINNFSASGIEGYSRAVKLTWSAPQGANGDLVYDIRFSENGITPENFNSAKVAQNIPPVNKPGEAQELEIKDLTLDKIYYFAIKTKDIAGMESATSNVSYSFSSAALLSPWPSYKGGNLRTGQSAYSGPETANLKWKYKTDGWVINCPSVSEDGNIYLWSREGSESYGNLISLADNQTEGLLNWKSPVGFYFEKTPIIDAEGNIIVGGFNTGGQSLLKINNQGMLQRAFGPPEYAAVYGPIVAKNSETDYFVVFNDGRISARDGNFSQKWENSIMQGMEKKDYENIIIHIWGLPSEDSDGNIYIAAVIQITKREPPRYEPVFDYEKSVYRLISFDSTGNLRWTKDVSKIKRPITYPEFLSPAIGQNTGYISAQNNLYAFSLADGEIQWSYFVGEEGGKSYDSSSPSLASDGMVYNIFSDGYLYAISSGGEYKWKALIMQSEDYASRLPAAAIGGDGTIYAGGENVFYAFNPDGTEKWRYSAADDFGGKKAIAGVPAIGKDGTVYVSFGGVWQVSGGMFYAFGR